MCRRREGGEKDVGNGKVSCCKGYERGPKLKGGLESLENIDEERESGGEFCACSPCCQNIRGREKERNVTLNQRNNYHRTYFFYFLFLQLY